MEIFLSEPSSMVTIIILEDVESTWKIQANIKKRVNVNFHGYHTSN